MIVFLDTSVLLTMFGTARVDGATSRLLATPTAKMTFEKCVYEAYLAFRGVGGKKPDEGRADWARRYLTQPGDPIPLAEAAGRIHGGSLRDAHYWVGQADEAQWATPETTDEWDDEIRRFVSAGDSSEGRALWRRCRAAIDNHRRYERLFAEFRTFLARHEIEVRSYEQLYRPEGYGRRFEVMNGISERSTIPSEDFEIVVAALLSGAELFVTTDTRLLAATLSIEQNLRSCDFAHLSEAVSAISAIIQD